MPTRLRVYDCRISRLPGVVGLCTSDSLNLCKYLDSAQRRLLFCREAGEEGWYGGWAEVAFIVNRDRPYVTLPPELARLELAVLCDEPIPVYNQFFEYLQFGNGRLPKQFARCFSRNCLPQVLSRNNVPTMISLTNTPQYLRFYASNEADSTARIFISGIDSNDQIITNMDGAERVRGVFYGLEQPYVTTAEQFNRIIGLQKDQTLGTVSVFQLDPTTGDEVLLTVLQPGETTASYRRYYFSDLPLSCCGTPASGVAEDLTIRALCKLEPIPLTTDTDYLIIQNLEAMIEECQAVRYSEMDTENAKKMAAERHHQAVGYLNGELTHYYGKETVSVISKPYGSADLRKQAIGTML